MLALQLVSMDQLDFKEAGTAERDVWRFVTAMYGGQCAMISGMIPMLQSFAGNLNSQALVHIIIIITGGGGGRGGEGLTYYLARNFRGKILIGWLEIVWPSWTSIFEFIHWHAESFRIQ